MRPKRYAVRLILPLMLLTIGGLSNATTAFEPGITTDAGTKLVLNGAGTRYKAVFKVYDMGLYVKTKSSAVDSILASSGPKRLNFVALREISGTELGTAFMRGMASNSQKAQLNRQIGSTARLIEIFSGKSKLMPGENFAIEFNPGKGTTFFIDGRGQGDPVGNDEFFELILRIWLGSSPADWKLKDDLLGIDR